jgi:hypothetical protein
MAVLPTSTSQNLQEALSSSEEVRLSSMLTEVPGGTSVRRTLSRAVRRAVVTSKHARDGDPVPT